MPEVRAGNFAVLCSVHEFLLNVLGRQLHHEVPLPAGLQTSDMASPTEQTVATLRHWLNLLDLSTTPPMFRDELANSDGESAAALLQYYAQKPEHVATDRDKTDFVVTWLYRDRAESGAWQTPGSFEKHVTEIVGAPATPLPEEYRQLLREFEFLCTEVEDTEDFDKLMDSAMVQRVRDIKASFGRSFYHPKVLSTVAAYNVDFGKKFDELFKKATAEIRQFAQNVQQEGGSVMTPVEDGVTVKQLEDIEEQKILKTDYREAQEQFRKVSKFKKVVDRKRKRAAAAGAGANSATRIGHLVDDDRLAVMVPAESQLAIQMEEGKLLTLADSIRSFVKAADPTRAQVVPLKHGTITLAPHEVEAFRADYHAEKSFRGDFASTVIKAVACCARIEAELMDYAKMRSSAYLWKPHADSLTTLVKQSQVLNAEAKKVNATAMQRGLAKKVDALNSSLTKLQEKAQMATNTLAQLGNK